MRLDDRLADLAIRLWRRDETAIAELGRLADVRPNGDGSYTVTGPSGIVCGIVPGHDPVTQAVQLGFLFLGQLWPMAVPDMLRRVHRQWRAETKREKETCDVR